MVQLNKALPTTGEWECMECGYIEEGSESRRPLKCPECSAPASALEFFSYEDEGEEWDRTEDEDELDDDYEDEEDEFDDYDEDAEEDDR